MTPADQLRLACETYDRSAPDGMRAHPPSMRMVLEGLPRFTLGGNEHTSLLQASMRVERNEPLPARFTAELVRALERAQEAFAVREYSDEQYSDDRNDAFRVFNAAEMYGPPERIVLRVMAVLETIKRESAAAASVPVQSADKPGSADQESEWDKDQCVAIAELLGTLDISEAELSHGACIRAKLTMYVERVAKSAEHAKNVQELNEWAGVSADKPDSGDLLTANERTFVEGWRKSESLRSLTILEILDRLAPPPPVEKSLAQLLFDEVGCGYEWREASEATKEAYERMAAVAVERGAKP